MNTSIQNTQGAKNPRISDLNRISFATTKWSMVMAVGNSDAAKSATALEELCRRYWPPLYMYIRRKGYDRHAAEDLTQGFFAHLLDSGVMTRVDRSKGRFRSFMIGTLKNFLLNENDRNNALKRGGGMQIIPLDETLAESIYQDSPADSVTPEKQFDRDWALGVMRAALERLKSEYSTVKKRDLFCVLETGLTGETETGWLHQASSRLGMTEATVRVALHRLRRRYGDLLRDEISQTVLDEADIDDEIRLMFSALG